MNTQETDVRLRELERKIEELQDDWVSLARDVTTVLEASRREQKGVPILLNADSIPTGICPGCPAKPDKPCSCPATLPADTGRLAAEHPYKSST